MELVPGDPTYARQTGPTRTCNGRLLRSVFVFLSARFRGWPGDSFPCFSPTLRDASAGLFRPSPPTRSVGDLLCPAALVAEGFIGGNEKENADRVEPGFSRGISITNDSKETWRFPPSFFLSRGSDRDESTRKWFGLSRYFYGRST